MIDLLSDLDEMAAPCSPYRCLIRDVVIALRDEGFASGGPEDMPPPMAARFEMMRRSLADVAVPDTGFRHQVVSLVRMIERPFRRGQEGWQRVLIGQSLLTPEQALDALGETLGDLYTRATAQLIQDGIYPVSRPPRWCGSLRYTGGVSKRPYETRAERVRRRMAEIAQEAAVECGQAIDPDFMVKLDAEMCRSRLIHSLERAW